MILYALVIQSETPDSHLFTSKLLDLNLSLIVAKDSAQAMSILTQEPYLVHIIMIDAILLKTEPLFISQLRMYHQLRHIAVIGYNCVPDGPMHHEGYAIRHPEDIENLIDSLTHYAKKILDMKCDLGTIVSAQFEFKTLAQGYLLAQYLAKQYPHSDQIIMGITELFINAVEHGNLEISYEDKSALLASGRWTEEVELRLLRPEYKDRVVSVFFEKTPQSIELVIKDCGHGFSWSEFEHIDPRRLLASHGRGIMMAKSLSFTTLNYLGNGNTVKAIFVLDRMET